MGRTATRRTGAGGSGPAPLYDPETAKRRKAEQTYRYKLLDQEVAIYLERNHPKIFQQARNHAEAEVARRRGPLPGD